MEQITQVSIEGYFPKSVAEKLVEKLSGKTYMNFEISFSNECGNCILVVATKRPKTSKKELKEMFIHVALWELAEAN